MAPPLVSGEQTLVEFSPYAGEPVRGQGEQLEALGLRLTSTPQATEGQRDGDGKG